MPTPLRRNARAATHLAGVATALAVAVATLPSTASGSFAPRFPAQGLYEGCAPGSAANACIERLATIRAAGFRYVLNYSAWYGSAADVRRYADAAAALDLRLIWPLNHPAWRGLRSLTATYSTLGSSFAPPGLGAQRPRFDDTELAASAIELVAHHPATWGFYIGDELPAAEAGRVRRLSATVRQLAPGKPQLYIARPGVGRLQPFARYADIAGADVYPVGSGDPPVRRAARSASVVTAAAGARTAMALQAFSWSQYAPDNHPPLYPTSDSLRAMRDAAIRHAHPAMILWYSYQDILRSDDPQRRWRDLVRGAFSRSGSGRTHRTGSVRQDPAEQLDVPVGSTSQVEGLHG